MKHGRFGRIRACFQARALHLLPTIMCPNISEAYRKFEVKQKQSVALEEMSVEFWQKLELFRKYGIRVWSHRVGRVAMKTRIRVGGIGSASEKHRKAMLHEWEDTGMQSRTKQEVRLRLYKKIGSGWISSMIRRSRSGVTWWWIVHWECNQVRVQKHKFRELGMRMEVTVWPRTIWSFSEKITGVLWDETLSHPPFHFQWA